MGDPALILDQNLKDQIGIEIKKFKVKKQQTEQRFQIGNSTLVSYTILSSILKLGL